MTTNETILLREDQVAERLSVSRACLRKWRNQNRGPSFIKLAGGSAVRYRETDLSAWIQSQPSGGSSDLTSRPRAKDLRDECRK